MTKTERYLSLPCTCQFNTNRHFNTNPWRVEVTDLCWSDVSKWRLCGSEGYPRDSWSQISKTSLHSQNGYQIEALSEVGSKMCPWNNLRLLGVIWGPKGSKIKFKMTLSFIMLCRAIPTLESAKILWFLQENHHNLQSYLLAKSEQ